MDCKKSNEIMMIYLDSPLSINKRGAEKFHRHLERCDACREDFQTYNEIVSNLQEKLAVESAEPPMGFEDRVIEKILALELTPKKPVYSLENITIAVWSIVSVLFGVYFAIALQSDTTGVIGASDAFTQQFSYFISSVTDFLNRYQYVFIIGASALLLLQARIRNRLVVKAGETAREE